MRTQARFHGRVEAAILALMGLSAARAEVTDDAASRAIKTLEI